MISHTPWSISVSWSSVFYASELNHDFQQRYVHVISIWDYYSSLSFYIVYYIVEWCIYAHGNLVIIGLDDGLDSW